ncbi:hypothetical protein [Vibrio phage VEN]|uniref:Uncharacterized protein n=1 Tax=Vibrio phage VEN TaxID=2059879 RepID=A0A2H5BMY3_9CAUD|nr:hypothetical protein HOS56_gp15 [Vibrio phage VEN]AUG87668.1 hypothetical protein [Vibrio phage VEN]
MKLYFLPVHKMMHPTLKRFSKVVHNGGGSRQGWQGTITRINENSITVKFSELEQEYTWDWFKVNFYISTIAISKMKDFFNGEGYLKKYRTFCCQLGSLNTKRNTHQEMKGIIDSVNEGYTPIYTDKRPQTASNIKGAKCSVVITDDIKDPLDEVGTFMVIDNDGKWHGTHKTQRLAEIAASSIVKEKNKRLRIVKHCADVDPRVIVEADVTRK